MSDFPITAVAWTLLLWPASLCADTITLTSGERKTGRIVGMEQETLVLSTQPVPGLPAVELRIPKKHLNAIEFSEAPQRDAFLKNATQTQLSEVALLWQRFAPLLSLPGSPSADIGLRYGTLLLEAKAHPHPEGSLSLFEKIAQFAPTTQEREAAQQGVLRSLLARNEWGRAAAEADSLCKKECGTPLWAEARLTLGLLHAASLRKLTEENPRWQQDDFIRPARDRLQESALDALLGAAVLPGVPVEIAARALQVALEVYELAGALSRARALASDLAARYPDTAEASAARAWLETHPAQPPNPSPIKPSP